MGISGRWMSVGIQIGVISIISIYSSCAPIGQVSQSSTDSSAFAAYSRLTCNPNETPSATPLKRLSQTEYRNSIRDILSRGGLGSYYTQLANAFQIVPTDRVGKFKSFDATISQNHINGYYQVANQIADYLGESTSRMNTFRQAFAGCSSDSSACLRNFISGLGLWTFRRPLTNQELDRYQGGVTSSGIQAFRDVVFVFLQSPQFLFHVQTEGQAIGGNDSILQLSAYELASKLSFAFWTSMPDATLFDMARSGAILNENGFQQAIEHIFSSSHRSKVQSTFRDFYTDWFRLDTFETFEFSVNRPKFQAYLEGAQTPDIADMIGEVHSMMDHYTWQTEGSMTDLLSTTRSFARSPALANIYGVQPWDGSANQDIQLPANERAGLLTRSFFLISPDEETHPILRSVYIRKEILCDTIPAPPSNLTAEELSPPDPNPNFTTRERTEQKTSARTCNACHSFINPVGFALEPYDGLGRFRQIEKIFDDDGNYVTQPIDAQVVPNLQSLSEPTVDGPIELSQAMAQSTLVDQCFARQYWRYVNKRLEERGDHCGIKSVSDSMSSDGLSLQQAIRRIVMNPEFRRRYIGN